ncbi:hypothetical protein LO762_04705 [Actinocorallia sp. API 0066]|uniref:hypothetical protein n=1 Tax=Actinocorallia sp. API 0066 TaxID=2896846 RepID=UPI001E336D9D|nr:hypothetical protein [Actinocorallia sp. API 0066]MCD0448498.1 hypothetical protein [Actinocorallia sp. API 0066]
MALFTAAAALVPVGWMALDRIGLAEEAPRAADTLEAAQARTSFPLLVPVELPADRFLVAYSVNGSLSTTLIFSADRRPGGPPDVELCLDRVEQPVCPSSRAVVAARDFGGLRAVWHAPWTPKGAVEERLRPWTGRGLTSAWRSVNWLED